MLGFWRILSAGVVLAGLGFVAYGDEPPAPEKPAPKAEGPAPKDDPAPAKPRPPLPGKSRTVISNTGNGFGNTIIVDNGGAGRGEVIISNTRNGVGNRLIISGREVELPPAPVHKGKDNRFWSFRVWCEELECLIYWDPRALTWYSYHPASDTYRPVEWFAGRERE